MKKNRVITIFIGAFALIIGTWVFMPVISGKTVNNISDKKVDQPEGEKDVHLLESPKTSDELFSVKCEHNIPQYTCDECRYELGLVKIPHDLMKDNGGPIETAKSVVKKIATSFEASGEVQLDDNKKVNISPRIPGVVTSVNADLGTKVKKGDVLFEIESTELGQTIGEFRKNFAMTELLRRNYERKKSLFDQKITSEAELIDNQMSYEQSKTELEATKNKLYAMGLNSKEIASFESTGKEFSTGRLPFRAPISGILVSKLMTAGEMVEPGNNVIVLADLSNVWVWLNIYEQDIAGLSAAYGKGHVPVEITTGAYPSEVFYGKIDYLSSVINENSRALNVRVSLNNKENRLRPGMFCHARIYNGESGDVLTIPKDAVLNDEGKTFVFKHVKEDFYLQVFVKTGRKDINSIEILNGLTAGDEVVTAGAFMLKSDVLREKMGAGCAD